MKVSRRKGLAINGIAGVTAAVIVLPFVWLIVSSISPQKDLIATPLRWIPSQVDGGRYREIFFGNTGGVGATFRAAVVNSLVVTCATVAVALLVGVIGAYAFARLRFRFRRLVLITFLATYMFPQVALLVPLYFVLNSLSLLDNRIGLIIVDCALVIPFALWILSNYFVTIPVELEEAARVDGTSRLGALVYIIIPASRPGIVAALLFAFLLGWDEFMYALVFTDSNAAKTLPVAIAEFAGRYTTDFGLVAAGGVLASIPPVIIAIVFQRYIVSGLAAGGVKG